MMKHKNKKTNQHVDLALKKLHHKGAYLGNKKTANNANNMVWPLYLSLSVLLCSGGWRSRSHSPAISWERLGGQPVPTRHRAGKSTLVDMLQCSSVSKARHLTLSGCRGSLPWTVQFVKQNTKFHCYRPDCIAGIHTFIALNWVRWIFVLSVRTGGSNSF